MPLHPVYSVLRASKFQDLNFLRSWITFYRHFIRRLGRSARHKILLVDENTNTKVSQLRLCPEQDLNSQSRVQAVEDGTNFRPL